MQSDLKVLDSNKHFNDFKKVDTKKYLENEEIKLYSKFNRLFKLALKREKNKLQAHNYIYQNLQVVKIV